MIESRQIPVKRERLIELFPDGEWTGSFPGEFSSVTDNSRKVAPGAIFIAILGYETDGHLYLQQALEAGAALLVVDLAHVKANPSLIASLRNAPMLLVSNTRRAASILAAEFFGHPGSQTRLHGVTGTKGKTTTVHLLADILTADGLKPATMGTLGIEFDGRTWESKLTTPGPIEFQEILRALVGEGASDICCEVSAHAGGLARTASVRFESVAYMNLSRDHGDHFSPEEYLDAKLAIARDAAEVNPLVWGIGNARDPHTEAFLAPIKDSKRFKFAAFEESEDPGSIKTDLYVQILARSSNELKLLIVTPTWRRELTLPLVGRFNAQNAAAAGSIAAVLGIDPDSIALGLSNARQIPGRLERTELGQRFLVVTDYAHAPQPAAEVIAALRDITPGRLICVMGAGGSRDRGKRPMIGEVLARDCDIAVITSDNPRKEEPLDIINDILVGVQRIPGAMAKTVVEPDRKKAIELALERAVDGDTVAILGKGHENYQIFKDETIHFDDREVAADWLKAHGFAR